jgi:predicted  nucleic acid-binding Zn-ribbon protein
LAADNRQLNKLGKQLGSLGAGRLDQGAVDRAQKRVDHYAKIENRREKHLEHELAHLADRIEHKLDDLHLLAKLDFKKGELALAVAEGQSHNAKANRTAHRPAGRP